VLGSIRYFLSDVRHWLATHRVLTAMLVITIAAVAVAVYAAANDSGGSTTSVSSAPAPAPRVVVKQVAVPEETDDLGFPTFATKNTTRVSGADPTADAAAVALAVWPSTGQLPGPDAVSFVDAGDWQAGVAAASLVAAPVGAPILLTESGAVPPLSGSALRALDPQGSDTTAGRQVFVIGSAASPEGFQSLEVAGDSPAAIAAEVAKLRERLAGKPDHIVIASSDDPGYAMPAAAWAARSGDPVLFTGRDDLPAATVAALRADDGVPVFVLGPEAAVSKRTFKDIEHVAPGTQRIGDEGEAESSVAFARFTDGDFGWNINDPGHGFVLANSSRPMDAAVAAPLSASGTWGPLLVAPDGAALPDALKTYLLDLKPGYTDDPTRAVYNHIWLVGDTSALSVDLQGEVDDLAEVAPVTSGSGAPETDSSAGQPESEPNAGQDNGQGGHSK
jgi:ell wall binding domain 2 (CWB2)